MSPTPIEDEFLRFYAMAVERKDELTDADRADIRNTFFAGAHAAFAMILASGEHSTDRTESLLARMDAELEAFTTQLGRAAGALPKAN